MVHPRSTGLDDAWVKPVAVCPTHTSSVYLYKAYKHYSELDVASIEYYIDHTRI